MTDTPLEHTIDLRAENGQDPRAAQADTKDWTWVLTEKCPDCGFDATAVSGRDVSRLVEESVPRWQAVLRRDDARLRPRSDVWSPLEYACHVRDVFEIFTDRARLICSADGATFANWDQDATAVDRRYWQQDPATVSAQLAAAGGQVAATFAAVPEGSWERLGTRSNGSVFTLDSLGRYFVHDIAHHLMDVGG
jgi:hypothetical protein